MAENVLVLDNNESFEKAVKLLDANGNGVLAVVNEKKELVGLITDGDIRKSIIKGQLNLEHIINRNPYKLNINSSKKQIISYLKNIHRREIPLVDENNKFVKIFSLDEEEFNLKSNWVVIMAGGLGTRLGELTKDKPKPMLEVNDKPMIEHIIDSFVSFGFTKFMISVNYKAEVIKQYFKNGSDFGIEVIYLEEKMRLGTGGALSLIDFEIKEPFFIINGDILTKINFESMLSHHSKNNAKITIATKEYEYQIPYGVINSDNIKITSIIEKPTKKFLVNAGIYVLNPEVLEYIPKNKFYDMTSLLESFIEKGDSTISFPIKEYWLDIGRKEEYSKANDHYTKMANKSKLE